MSRSDLGTGRCGCTRVDARLCTFRPAPGRYATVFQVRMELAEYIAHVRVKEAERDLAEFWETHKLKASLSSVKCLTGGGVVEERRWIWDNIYITVT